MNKYKVAIVATVHIQPSDAWIKALEYAHDISGDSVIIIDDSDGVVKLPDTFAVYDYKKQEELLGPDLYKEFLPFQKSSSCKSLGNYIAYIQGFDIIMGIDSDCIIPNDFSMQHIHNLESKSYGWENTISNTEWFPRGFPYSQRNLKTILSLGLWKNELDLYGTDRVKNPMGKIDDPKNEPLRIAQTYVPLSGMNWACWREAIPGLLFLPVFELDFVDGGDLLDRIWKFQRHDDIWGGYIFQKIMFSLGHRIVYGNPIVYHDTIVVPEEDAKAEEPMIKWEDDFYKEVDSSGFFLVKPTYKDRFASLASLGFRHGQFAQLSPTLKFWTKLFEHEDL